MLTTGVNNIKRYILLTSVIKTTIILYSHPWFINPRRACAAMERENAVTYSAGNEGQNICGVFSETAPLQRSSTPSVVRPCVQSAAESTHAHYSMYEAAISSCVVVQRRRL